MAYDVLLLDADNTLFDFDRAEEQALFCSFALCNLPYSAQSLGLYRSINSKLWRDFEQGLITKEAVQHERFSRLFNTLKIVYDVAAFRSVFVNELGKGAFLLPGALEVCHMLSQSKLLYIITNGLSIVQHARLAASALRPYITNMFVSEAIGHQKPLAAFFDVVFNNIGIARSAALIVGDSLTADIQGGYNAAVDTCWFNPRRLDNNTTIHPTYTIHQLSELPDLCTATKHTDLL